MKPIRFDDEAEKEFLEAVRWYEQQRKGLGERFFQAVGDELDEIREQPTRFALAPDVAEQLQVRRAAVPGFPYSVVFLERAEDLYIVAVAHGRRKPGYWQARAR